MGRRRVAILVFIIGILILALVAFSLLQGGDQETPVTEVDGQPAGELVDGVPDVEVEPTMPPTVGVYVSLQTVPRGYQYPLTEEELLDQELVVLDQRVAGAVEKDAITDVADLLGLYARNDIYQGETLTADALVDDPTLIGIENFGPSSLIPPGSIAAAIPMDRLNSVAYALDEGDHIDIMVTFLFYQLDEEFQTYLQNAGVFFVEESLAAVEAGTEGAEGETEQVALPEVFIISPYGRFEELPTGDLAHVGPSEAQRPIPISMVLQNAKVIQVGRWEPPALAQPPTPIPTPSEEEATPTPVVMVTPIPEPPDVLVVALSPQQQLLIKYAIESFADIDFALRGANDGQIYTVENIDLDFLLQRFGIDVPANFGFSVDIPAPNATATPEPSGATGSPPPEGG